MSIIQAYATRYEKVSYYDSEFVIKGVLRIDTREYGFTHYDGAFAFSRLKIKAGKVKAVYDEEDGFQMQQGRGTPEGDLLYTNQEKAVEYIRDAASAYLITTLDAWVEYFNFATSCAGPFAYRLTRFVAYPDEKFRCTVRTPSPNCALVYSFGFDEEEHPRLESPLFLGTELLETSIDTDFVTGPGRWLSSIFMLNENESGLPLDRDYSRIVSLETALDCKIQFAGFPDSPQPAHSCKLILFSDLLQKKSRMRWACRFGTLSTNHNADTTRENISEYQQ